MLDVITREIKFLIAANGLKGKIEDLVFGRAKSCSRRRKTVRQIWGGT